MRYDETPCRDFTAEIEQPLLRQAASISERA